MKKEICENERHSGGSGDPCIGELIRTAAAQRSFSYAPYSGYRVGAALLAKNGRIFTGCNIENAAYGPSMCAERTAFFKAVSEGVREFDAICIVGGKEGEAPGGYCAPCGSCRQVMREFCDPASFRIILAAEPGDYGVFTLQDLLPQSFGPENLR